MTKILSLLFMCLAFSFGIYAQDQNDFEAELRLLEHSELEADARELKAVEDLWIEDEANVGQAATMRDTPVVKPATLKEESLKPRLQKARRVRSR